MRAIDAGILICKECHELNRQEADTDEQSLYPLRSAGARPPPE